jgi:long-subunit acyl-CoA synthetase (AMP-forming)
MPFLLEDTICKTLLERVQFSPKKIAFYSKTGSAHHWKPINFESHFEVCRQISEGLISLGLLRGDRVVVLSATQYEWVACDMAILGSGAVTVPIYPSNTPEDVGYVLEHSEAKFAFIQNKIQYDKLLEIAKKSPEKLRYLKRVILFEAGGHSQAQTCPLF